MAGSEDSHLMYIYELPYTERKALCNILDLGDKWEELGGRFMDYSVTALDQISSRRFHESPTNLLLKSWGEQNHTVLELFILLSRMHSYRAMLILKPLVDKKYHALIRDGEENLLRVFEMRKKGNSPGPSESPQPVENGVCTESKKDMKIGTCNLNKTCKEANVGDKVVLPPVESDIENDSPSKLQETIIRKENKNENPPRENKENRCPPDNKDNRGLGETPKPPSEAQRKLSNASSVTSSVETCTPLISYTELETATNGWDKHLIIGRGGFGTVYKGLWKNTQVAIKKLESQDDASDEFILAQQTQSIREIKYLNQFRHDNILPLYGHSFGGDTPCLVYQYMENGSLEDRLQCRRGTMPLNWDLRCTIATGVARGLQFLHYRNSPYSSKPLIHGDIKSANILLDPSFVPRIGDFGLAREGPPQQYTHVTVSRVHGTRPYLPSDFLRHKKFSTKVDTYSFGIVLFEIATGLRAYEESRPKKFLGDFVKSCDEVKLAELGDTKAGIDSAGISPGLLAIGKRCVLDRAHDRPEMKTVLEQLTNLTNIFKQSMKAHYMLRQNSLSPTTPYTIQLYYDHMSQQRRSSIPNSTAMAVGTAGSIGGRQVSPHPIPLPVVQSSIPSPHISVTPPSIGVQMQNNYITPGQEPSRNETSGIPPSSCASPFVTSPADELPLLSVLGVSTPKVNEVESS